MTTLREKIEGLERIGRNHWAAPLEVMDEGKYLRRDDVLRIVAEHEQALKGAVVIPVLPTNTEDDRLMDEMINRTNEQRTGRPLLDLTPGGPVKGGGDHRPGYSAMDSASGPNVTAPPVGQAGGDGTNRPRWRKELALLRAAIGPTMPRADNLRLAPLLELECVANAVAHKFGPVMFHEGIARYMPINGGGHLPPGIWEPRWDTNDIWMLCDSANAKHFADTEYLLTAVNAFGDSLCDDAERLARDADGGEAEAKGEPAWLRELARLRAEACDKGKIDLRHALMDLASLSRAIMSGNGAAVIPEGVAKFLTCISDSTEPPSPAGTYRAYGESSWRYQGSWERAPGGVSESSERILSAIDFYANSLINP